MRQIIDIDYQFWDRTVVSHDKEYFRKTDVLISTEISQTIEYTHILANPYFNVDKRSIDVLTVSGYFITGLMNVTTRRNSNKKNLVIFFKK